MSHGLSKVDQAVGARLREAVAFLEEIIKVPSAEGAEQAVQEVIAGCLESAGLDVILEAIPEKLREDPEFTPGRAASFEGRPNLVARRGGKGGGRSLILNTHSDVVPAPDWPEAFASASAGGMVTGRGAVDAKGQIATVYLTLLALEGLGVTLSGDLEVQVVIDEEVGGNGTLALLREGHTADAAVVLEPTSLRLHPANRGALWFTFTVTGEPAHMARKAEVSSAIDYSMELINILYRYEKDLTKRARSNELFSMHKNPVQINIGRMRAGEWPATVAATSVIEGGIGFLPDMTLEDVKRDLPERIDREASGYLREHYRLEFSGLHNEAFATPLDSGLVRRFQAALENTGLDATATGWIASCDARLLAKVGGMDTIVFGPGDLTLAHSNREKIPESEMEMAARALVRFIIDWCR